jgi:hypothetical protein
MTPAVQLPSPKRSVLCATILSIVVSMAPRALEARRAPTRPGPVEVQAMGGSAPGVTDALRAHMREQVARQVRALADARLLTSPQGYVVDGSIQTLQVVERADALDVSCGVRLILSARRSGAILVMTSGEASVRARRSARPALRERLLQEVLEGAVHAASDELLQHFQARRKS